MTIGRFAFFWMIAISANFIHARNFVNGSEVSSDASLIHRVCKDIRQNDIEDVIQQLESADQVYVKTQQHLVLVLSNDFSNTIKLLQFLEPSFDKKLKNLFTDNQNEQFLMRSDGSIFAFEDDGVLYYGFPGFNEMRNEVFAKYIAYKVTNKARNVKIALIDIIPSSPQELQNFFKNAEMFITDINQFNNSIVLMEMDDQFRDFNYLSYESNVNNVMNIEVNSKLSIPAKTIADSSEVGETSSYDFRGRFIHFINKRMKYTKIEGKFLNFAFFENENLTGIVECVGSKLRENLTSDMNSLVQMIHNHFLDLEKNSTNMQDIWEQLHQKDIFSALESELLHSRGNAITFVLTMNRILRFLGIENGHMTLSRMVKNMEQLEFLESGKTAPFSPSQFFKPLIDIYENHISKSISFYNELKDLFEEATQNLDDHFHFKLDRKFDDLAKRIGPTIDNPDVKLKALNYLKRSILGIKKNCLLIQSENSEDEEQQIYELQIHGDTIRFSEIPKRWFNLCPGRITYVEIFARDVIIMDEDFNSRGETMQFVAVAPTFRVVGERKMNLTGADGQGHQQLHAGKGQPGEPGEDGLHGLPGKSGGIFIVVSETIINGNKLQVFANGGDGGPGQHGGEGGNGAKPQDPDSDRIHSNDKVIVTRKLNKFWDFVLSEDCTHVLVKLTAGGDGGHGGLGGEGGNAGQSFLHELIGNARLIQPTAKPGKQGVHGTGGKGGKGNQNTKEVEHPCPKENLNLISNWEKVVDASLKHGKNGTTGASRKNIEKPMESKGFRDIAFVVNGYKSFIMPYLFGENKTMRLVDFYQDLINNEVINNKYNTFALLDELKGLERHLSISSGTKLLSPMYDDLRKRIVDYAQLPVDSEVGDDYNAALGYTYTTVLTRASHQLMAKNTKVIIDLQGYLDEISKNVDELRNNEIRYATSENAGDEEETISEVVKIIETQFKTEIDRIREESRSFKIEKYNTNDTSTSAMRQKTFLMIANTLSVAVLAIIPGGRATAVIASPKMFIRRDFFTVYTNVEFDTDTSAALKEEFKRAIDSLISMKEELEKTLKIVGENFSDLLKLQGDIYNELRPVFEIMYRDLELGGGSSILKVPDVSDWGVQKALENVKLIMRQFTRGFKVADEMKPSIKMLEDTIDISIYMYNRIEYLQNDRKLAAYVARIEDVDYQNPNVSNEALNDSLLENRAKISKNLALIQYGKIYDAFKWLAFPFVDAYGLNEIQKPSVLESLSSDRKNSSWLVEEILGNIGKIEQVVGENEKFGVESKWDEKFIHDNERIGEIFRWKNETHNEMISDLLEGKEVILSPDARMLGGYTVKFKEIRIGFVSEDEKLHSDLKKKLNHMYMEMTHSGNSYFTCGEKMYLMTHQPITFLRSFNEMGQTSSVSLFAKGDGVASPFATWKVKIKGFFGEIEKNYLSDFKDEVDLVLEAPVATFIPISEGKICQKHDYLTEYYEEYVPMV